MQPQEVQIGKKLFSVAEFCAAHGISRSTFYEEVREQKLVARKVRGRTSVTDEDAAAWRNHLPRLKGQEAA